MFWFGISQNFYGHSTAKNDVPETYWEYFTTESTELFLQLKLISGRAIALAAAELRKWVTVLAG